MEAIRWHGRRDIRYENIAKPGPIGPDDVLVQVAYAGICGTDLEEYLDGPIFVPVNKPHPLTGKQAPLVLGHEFSGIVAGTGEHVSHLKVGDAVAADSLIYCGQCGACQVGRYNLCPQLAALGQMADGGLAEYVRGPAYTFVPVGEVPLDEAALAEPLAVAVRAVRRAFVAQGDDVLVIGGGTGTIGLLVAQVARVFGAQSVCVVEPHDGRRAMAGQLGADPVVKTMQELDRTVSWNKAIECTGLSACQREAVLMTRPGARVVMVGIPTQSTELDTLEVINGEKEVVGSLSHLVAEDFRLAVAMLQNRTVKVKPLISRVYPLYRGEEAFDMLARREANVIKILLHPGPDAPTFKKVAEE